jgi:hypothetical protein
VVAGGPLARRPVSAWRSSVIERRSSRTSALIARAGQKVLDVIEQGTTKCRFEAAVLFAVSPSILFAAREHASEPA